MSYGKSLERVMVTRHPLLQTTQIEHVTTHYGLGVVFEGDIR